MRICLTLILLIIFSSCSGYENFSTLDKGVPSFSGTIVSSDIVIKEAIEMCYSEKAGNLVRINRRESGHGPAHHYEAYCKRGVIHFRSEYE